MKYVYRAANILEAQIVKGMLQANGIGAEVGGYYLQGGVGEVAPMDTARVYVADDDEIRARKLIQDYENDEYITDE